MHAAKQLRQSGSATLTENTGGCRALQVLRRRTHRLFRFETQRNPYGALNVHGDLFQHNVHTGGIKHERNQEGEHSTQIVLVARLIHVITCV